MYRQLELLPRLATTLASLCCLWMPISAQAFVAREWLIEIKTPGPYELHVRHRLGTGQPPVGPTSPASPIYWIETKEKTYEQRVPDLQYQPFSPLSAEIASPQTIRVVIAGVPPSVLHLTTIAVLAQQTGANEPPPMSSTAQAEYRYPKWRAATSEIDKILALPEKKIDVGLAALTLAKEIYPEIDVAEYSRRLDTLAFKVRQLTNDSQDPETRIRALNTVLHLQEGFRYDHSPDARSNHDNYFLNGILDKKFGTCATMPLLYLAVGQRAGYPIYPVAAPDHMFVRYVDSSFQEQNIETTSGGKYFPDESYIRGFSVSQAGLKSGSYLRTMSYRELLGNLIVANALVFGHQGKAYRSIGYLEKAIELDPKFADYYDNQEIAYLAISKVADSEEWAAKYREKAKQYGLKAKKLGFVHPDTIALGRTIRGL